MTTPHTFTLKKLSGVLPLMTLALSICSILLLATCGRDRVADVPTPENEPTSAVETPMPVAQLLIDRELLGAESFKSECDQQADTSFSCSTLDAQPQLEVDVHAGTYARWALKWSQPFVPLTGHETLRLRATRSGDVKPNLYLIDGSDKRIATRLASAGLKEGSSEIHIPLTEIRDEDGNTPDFSQVKEVQIVFEWADMRGTLMLESLQFDSVWREPVTLPTDSDIAELTVPSGFRIEPLVGDVPQITQIDHTSDDDLLVSQQNGRVWWYTDANNDGVHDERRLYASGLTEVVGLLYDPTDGSIWLGGRGQLYRTADTDANGAADLYELRLDELPWGRHQNNGLAWNPAPDPFTGEAEPRWIYFGLGATGDLEIGGEYNATVLRFPRDGNGQADLEVVSRGNRNPYALAWGRLPHLNDSQGEPAWQLFASENGPDFNDAPDEVNHIRWQHHYGFPEKYGTSFDEPASELDGLPYSGSLYDVTPHASASGLAFIHNKAWPAEYRTLYVSLFGQVFSEKIVGHTVDRIDLTPADSPTGPTYRGTPTTFIAGLDRPLPLGVDPQGDMLVGDYATSTIYRVRYVGE